MCFGLEVLIAVDVRGVVPVTPGVIRVGLGGLAVALAGLCAAAAPNPSSENDHVCFTRNGQRLGKSSCGPVDGVAATRGRGLSAGVHLLDSLKRAYQAVEVPVHVADGHGVDLDKAPLGLRVWPDYCDALLPRLERPVFKHTSDLSEGDLDIRSKREGACVLTALVCPRRRCAYNHKHAVKVRTITSNSRLLVYLQQDQGLQRPLQVESLRPRATDDILRLQLCQRLIGHGIEQSELEANL